MKLQRPDPGIDAAKSGLHGKAGIFFNAGLLEKGEPRFDLQDLDPYLVFDSRESMLGTLENPTLDLDPATPSTLDVITATRAGTATFTDVNGLIASAPANTVRVDQTQGAELTPTVYQLVGNTDFTQSHWTKTASTVESGHASPDGNANAYKLIEDTSNSVHGIFETSTVSASPNATISVFVKYSGRRYVLIRFADQSVGRWYDLISGTLGITYLATPNDSTIEEIGNDWYRITLTHTSNAQARCEFWVSDTQSIPSYTGDGTSGVYIYGPQLEEGTTASDFVENTTGSPKFITGATYGPRVPMILVEPSATNLVEYSEDFSNSYWNKTDATVSAAPVAAPDGTMTATHVTATSDNSIIYRGGFQSGQTLSIWARTVSGAGTCYFHYQVGGIPITVTDQWQRFEVPLNNSNAYIVNLRGDSTLDELYIWGAQVETGSVATSYIPTSGSTAQRAADDLEITGSAFDFYNASEGTVYVELTSHDSINSFPVYFTQAAGRNSGSWVIQKDTANQINFNSWASGGNVANSLINYGSYTLGDLTRVSISYNSNSYEGSKDGSSVQTVTPSPMATTLVDRLFVGGSGTFQNTSRIKRLIYWPYHSDSL